MPYRPPSVRRAILGRVGLFLVGVALVTACAPGLIASIVLGVDDATAVVLRGDTVYVLVDLTRLGGMSDPVELSVAGLPSNVTASFSPPILSGAATESTLTLTAAAAASEATAALTITGTAGSVSDEVAVTLTVDSLAVQGHVLGLLQQPVIGAAVASQGETTFTNANGAFIIEGLSVPYDVVVSSTDGDGAVHVFEGLAAPMPVLRPFFTAVGFPSPGQGTTIDGSILGGALGAGEVVVVCVEGLAVAVYGCDNLAAGDSLYSISAGWFAGSAASVRLHALHFQVDADDLPTAYLGYETTTLNLVDGVGTLFDLDFDPVPADTLTGTASVPLAATSSGALVLARFGPNLSVPLAQLDGIGATFEAHVPVLPGLSYDVLVFAGLAPGGAVYTWKHDVGLDAGALAVALPAQPLAPADAAIGVDLTTPFSSTAIGGARTYVWLPDAAGPVLARTTTRTSVTVTDPALGGILFPAGAAYSWTVLGHGNDGVDVAAAGGYADFFELLLTANSGGPFFDRDRTFAIPGDERDFMFMP